jgi:NADH-ubiquinone oxidoreductase chain 4
MPTSLPLLTTLLAPILVRTFALNNLLLFYLLFETSLVPTILLILLWGYQPDRLIARFYIIIYTISASLPLLLGTIILLNQNNQLHIFSLTIINPSNINPQL